MSTIEGKNAVLEALRGGRRVRELLVAESVRNDARIAQIASLAASAGVTVRFVGRHELDRLSLRGAHQGVAAVAEPVRYVQMEELLARVAGATRALIVVADGITDPQNVGAMIRTCEAAGVAGFVLGKHRSAFLGAAAEKAAAGALAYLPIVQVTNISTSLDKLKEAGFWVTGAAGDGDIDLWNADLGARTVLVMGSEGKGLSRLVRRHCDIVVRIPVAGNIQSLNVSAATAVLVYEALRQQRQAG
ncbi:MAG: 23S rRNA (guanosine(2251)-2'-O)-methyltransferase RlmB [Actinobacteria bacterium]|nr:MAG: 23S rRNA (guanosine(2251)-2'-O)-methyltransferase RlmB [Actinomycetota bacterium]